MLKIENITASYHAGNPILRNISLELDEGGRLVILGRNGAGKTTFANTLFGAVPHISGRIRFRGQEVLKLPGHMISPLGIGYFKQGAPVFPQMSVGDNLLLVSGKRRFKDMRDRISELSEDIGLLRHPDVFSLSASNLSGGERTQLALAMALYNRPAMLVLDEPFAGLSPSNAAKVLRMLLSYHASENAGMILIAQDRQMASSFCDTHFYLREGSLSTD